MLAKVVNDIAGMLDKRGDLWFFASMLAPTGGLCRFRYQASRPRISRATASAILIPSTPADRIPPA